MWVDCTSETATLCAWPMLTLSLLHGTLLKRAEPPLANVPLEIATMLALLRVSLSRRGYGGVCHCNEECMGLWCGVAHQALVLRGPAMLDDPVRVANHLHLGLHGLSGQKESRQVCPALLAT